MSVDVKEVCEVYTKSLNLAFEPLEGKECGVDLTGIPNNEQTRELFEVAARTGSRLVLSAADIFVGGDCLDGVEYRLNTNFCREVKAGDRQALVKRAEAFLENARGLVEKLRPPVVRERPEYLRGRLQ